jgi:hypothetical protein
MLIRKYQLLLVFCTQNYDVRVLRESTLKLHQITHSHIHSQWYYEYIRYILLLHLTLSDIYLFIIIIYLLLSHYIVLYIDQRPESWVDGGLELPSVSVTNTEFWNNNSSQTDDILVFFSGKAVKSELSSPVSVFLSLEFGMRTCCRPHPYNRFHIATAEQNLSSSKL